MNPTDEAAAVVAVTVNGEARRLERGARVVDLVTMLGHSPDRPGVAVAVNGEMVPRAAWSDVALATGDRVELIGATQGG